MGKIFVVAYRKALRATWWPEYRDWVRDHVREELWAVIVGGGIGTAAGAWIAGLFTPGAVVGLPGIRAAAFAGVITGAVVFVLLLFFKWLASMLAAPSEVWKSQVAEIASLRGNNERLLKELADAKRKAELRLAVTARLELQYGERSALSPGRRHDIGLVRLKELEDEIGAGNYANAAEILESHDVLLRAVAAINPKATFAYRQFHERMTNLVANIERHFREEIAGK